MAKGTHRRDDVSPHEGERKYGDVQFADPANKKYPVDTPQHVRAAWSYINHKDNAAKYSASDVETIKKRIKAAAKKHGVTSTTDRWLRCRPEETVRGTPGHAAPVSSSCS